MIRVRFAPSPTGYLHIGNARTALFNYLFARENQGKFVLRIEDTDRERSRKEYEDSLMEDLKWVGIEWDEGPDIGGEYAPYRQSERIEIYREFAEKLLKEGKIYKCYCTKEEIEERNKKAGKDKSSGYDNKCRNLTNEEFVLYKLQGREPVLRFKVEPKIIKVNDLIRGEVSFDGRGISDFVIMKSDGTPIFNFAVVIDDFLMKITHVIRGEDHLSNTPKHILIFESIGAPIPQFAHMSMTLGPDKARLSKRHGATSVMAYKENGYLPEAFFNYIALLGWGTTESQELFTREELIKEFSIERCHKASAIFDQNKLLWMNGHYIREKSIPELARLSLPFLKEAGLISENPDSEELLNLEKLIGLGQERVKTLKEMSDFISAFLKEPVYEQKACDKFLDEKGIDVLKAILPFLEKLENFDHKSLEEAVRKFCEETNCKTGAIFHPLRVAVSGSTKGPGLFEMMEVLGKEKVIQRIKEVIKIK